MSEHAHAGSTKLYASVWAWLLALTVLEVVLAYRQMPLHTMLVILMGLSVIKAALIISYFMHLRFEKLSLFLTLFPALIFCIVLLITFFPDSARLYELRVP
ncbi:MAG: cytochrome C oxidase subunit IV family protein [Acidobacteria bacterium]|nr:cytochrome C oxidase subunit IV family protein [Acidobacteriota bacterium]